MFCSIPLLQTPAKAMKNPAKKEEAHLLAALPWIRLNSTITTQLAVIYIYIYIWDNEGKRQFYVEKEM